MPLADISFGEGLLFDSYVREQAHTTPAGELHKLNEPKEKGALSVAEFDRAKSRLLA